MKRLILCIFLLSLLWGCSSRTPVSVPDTNQDGKLTCTLEIRCDTLLAHLQELPEGKAALVPPNGQILAATELSFQAGDTVFDVFRRVLREKKIHFEYVDATVYDSVYIQGIGNLYEFDCGPQSGWIYTVNGVHLGIGCSSYTLSDGDAIVFSYTCDLGADLGADYET